MAVTLTTEEKLAWLEGYKAIEKLVNKKSFFELIKKGDSNWQQFWCSPENEPTLGVNDGFYSGAEAIGAYYAAREENTRIKTALIKKAHPELTNKTEEQLHGIGQLTIQNMSCQVIEVARDQKTAKGIWYYTLIDFDLTQYGPEARWYWGRVGIDFINEGGEWKIWHLMDALDFDGLMGTDWNEPDPERPVLPEYAAVADLKLPEPNVKKQNHEKFWRHRPVMPFPAVPKPYDTFANTFSYGM
jgi:hypothetical protein